MKLRFSLSQQILASMVCSVLFAYGYTYMGGNVDYVINYLKPIGLIFIKSLKLLLVPLLASSLLVSLSGVDNVKKFSRTGFKTIFFYLVSTLFSVSLGVLLGIFVNPGKYFPQSLRDIIGKQYAGQIPGVSQKHAFPDNLIAMFSENTNLLYIVIFCIVCGVLLFRVEKKQKDTLVNFFSSLRALLIEFMHLVMRFAPLGIFSTIASELIVMGKDNPSQIGHYLKGLFPYLGTVLFGLFVITFIFYPMLSHIFTPTKFFTFIRYMYPAQLIAFTTSSSTVALPTTIEQGIKMGIPRKMGEVLLSIGAAININGTAFYQGVAVMFISQAFGKELSLAQQISIVLYVTFSSIGEGGIPGGSLTSTAILLGILGIPESKGLALILLPDRLAEMARTATNITGDVLVTRIVVAGSEKKKGGVLKAAG